MSAGAAAHSEAERARGKAEDLRRRAERLEQRAAKFEQGERGEVAVADMLRTLLPAGFALIDDIRWPGTSRANIDHVVYGPPGMFVVDAKYWTGRVAVKDGVLRQNGYHRRQHTEKTALMRDALRAHLGESVGLPLPVMCMANQPELAAGWCGSTLVVGLRGLTAWMRSLPAIWPATHVDALSDWLPHVLQPADPTAGGSVQVARMADVPATLPPTPRATRSGAFDEGSRSRRDGGLYGWLRGR